MNAQLVDAAPDTSLLQQFDRMRESQRREPMPSLQTRLRRLDALRTLVEENEERIADAISADFGNRSRFEIGLSEVFVSLAEIKHAQRYLRSWMRPRRVRTPWYLLPGRARVLRQPKGIVGIISPWNYPLFLAIPPVAGAMAAGNRVLLKPSELTPRFSELLQQLVSAHFGEDEFAVVLGGVEVGQEFSQLPFDHLFFTGSTAVGREIAKAAAPNLTPVTLELGGKSPAILGGDVDLRKAATSIAIGKLLNCGQTCIAPDYCLVPRWQVDGFAHQLAEEAKRMYPEAAANPSYTSVPTVRHFQRLLSLVEEAQQGGAHVIAIGDADPGSRRLPLHIVVDPPHDSALMREEIFGPVMPVVAYDDIGDAIAMVNAAPRPLALYFFGDDRREQQRVLCETVSGGVTINDTLWHIAHPALPFGGSGDSGIGAYHGEHSFRLFSHEKGVYEQSKLSAAPLLHPPYGRIAELTLKLLRRWG
ncbi:MAG TPA: coniferyl aldehyde dehydrogenase [Terriglobales bacterium]